MTLVQFWTQERDLYKAKQATASAALVDLQKALDQAQHADASKPVNPDPADGLKKTQDAIAALDAEMAAKRAALAKATVPAEAQALVIDIRNLQISHRITTGAVLDLQEQVDTLRLDVSTQSQILQRVSSRLADSEARLKAAEEAARRRDKLRDRVTTAPVKDVPSQAATAKTGADHAAAKAKIDALPVELRTLAKKRFDLRVKRIADAAVQLRTAEDERVTQREAWGGDGKIEQERTAFERAEEAVQSFASTAQHEFDRALAALEAIAAVDLLTASETAAVPADAARTAAAANGEAVIDAQGVVHAAALDVENTEFALLAADPEVDLAADAGLTAKKGTLNTANTSLTDESTTNYPDKPVVDEWQAIVTDRSWKGIVDFFDAEATLDRLSALSGTGLASNMDNREAAYAAALADLAKARRRLEYVDDMVALRSERADDLSTARALRLVSAVRGDSY